ncbi:putative oxidoreductase YkwC [Sporosarcina sp. NCCP-2222]|uniref:NAD(P)-dependent oxidoreductase n=1 Tax=Sporosarcina sp. NCCP-2222 TaxID=2935073 RepID=UPI00207DE5E9|nr:NAD(P)-dependent oxidoreductase [Sporosarcina sp. NCCP-2222]GKV55763.1 putative oxidoreductase YkwC [Sporosarcina sp. NCCP-2222]
MQKKIGFIGTGVMGASIVRHLLKAGHEVSIFTRTAEKAAPLVDEGAKWVSSPREAAVEADMVFTMVGYPHDVEEVYFSDNGVFAGASKGQIFIDMTTSSPTLAIKIAKEAEKLGMHAMDAPVSGGDVGARNGTLSIMCGGDKETFVSALPVLEIFGAQIVYQGKAGAGQHAKMCNQIAIATNMIGVCESLAYGKKAGLDLDTVLESISSGAAGSWSLSNLAPRMLSGNFEPGFYIKHFQKDMDIALQEAEAMNLRLPGLSLAREMYDDLVAEGYGSKGTQALYLAYLD